MGKRKAYIKLALIVLFVFLFCLLIVILWKSDQNRYVDKSIVNDTPCALPCWQGITPGITYADEAMDILFNSPYIKSGSIVQSGTTELGGCVWSWRGPNRRWPPGLSWKNGVVVNIELGLTIDLSMQEVIDKFGYPEFIDSGGGGTPEHWYWIVNLYYPTQGIKFVVYTSEYSNVLKENSEVGAVLLYDSTTMREMMTELEAEDGSLVWSGFSEWQGYGNVSEIYANGIQWP